jgi:hypothetical protein
LKVKLYDWRKKRIFYLHNVLQNRNIYWSIFWQVIRSLLVQSFTYSELNETDSHTKITPIMWNQFYFFSLKKILHRQLVYFPTFEFFWCWSKHVSAYTNKIKMWKCFLIFCLLYNYILFVKTYFHNDNCNTFNDNIGLDIALIVFHQILSTATTIWRWRLCRCCSGSTSESRLESSTRSGSSSATTTTRSTSSGRQPILKEYIYPYVSGPLRI